MNTAKWFAVGSVSISLLGASTMGLMGFGLSYSLYSGLIVGLAVPTLFLIFGLLLHFSDWLGARIISKVAPDVEGKGYGILVALLAAIAIKVLTMWQQHKNARSQTP